VAGRCQQVKARLQLESRRPSVPCPAGLCDSTVGDAHAPGPVVVEATSGRGEFSRSTRRKSSARSRAMVQATLCATGEAPDAALAQTTA